MDNIIRKIENELSKLSVIEREEILNRLRNEVDEVDKKIVEHLSKRTFYSVLIGRVKRSLNQPTYSPKREKEINARIKKYLSEPLGEESLKRIYERILDESRAIQKEEAIKGNIYKTLMNQGNAIKNLMTKRQLIVVFSFFLIVLFVLYYTFFSSNNYEDGAVEKKFVVREGWSLSQIADKLFEERIIPSKTNFKIAAFVYGAEGKLRAARYRIPDGLNYLDLIDLFIDGNGDQLRAVNLYNGISFNGMVNRLTEQNICNPDSLKNILSSSEISNALVEKNSLLGYLLPGEYNFYESSDAFEIIDSLFKNMNEFFVDTLESRMKQMKLNRHQILTMASIIEGETNLISEMKTISGVYYNRLKIGMKLQADPTVQFIQPNGWKRLKGKDLKIDSPYNTYVYYGLPPGPINNPGRDAIIAALYPEQHKYLFFVVKRDGGHIFSNTFSDHKKHAREYHRWLNRKEKKS